MAENKTGAIPVVLKEELARRIVGEIVLSSQSGMTLRKWRDIFSITTSNMAERIDVSPSVVSDYEAGRRAPGTMFLRRFVEGLFTLDEQRGSRILRQLTSVTPITAGAVIDMREFTSPLSAEQLCLAVDGVVVAARSYMNRDVYGYTMLDSIRAIETLSGADFYQILGATSERALIFTNVSTGRSPMVAIRVQTIKPKLIVIHGAQQTDKLATHLAELERIPLISSRKPSVETLLDALNGLYIESSRRNRFG